MSFALGFLDHIKVDWMRAAICFRPTDSHFFWYIQVLVIL